jgi:hypothetical protein
MIRVRCVSIALLAILALLLSGCASPDPRPTPPAAGAPLVQPWGSVPSLATGEQIDQERVASFIESLQTKLHRHRQAGGTGRVPYRALTLSGGGSRGAWGAGVLSGWTVRGGRPQFDVVTGISTGALMAWIGVRRRSPDLQTHKQRRCIREAPDTQYSQTNLRA